MKTLGRITASLIVLALLAAGGYWYLVLKPTPIQQLQKDAEKYDGKEVLAYGKVTKAFGILKIGFYTIDDGTGELYVGTTNGVPDKGKWVTVKGTLTKAMKVQDKNMIGITEIEKHEGRYWGF